MLMKQLIPKDLLTRQFLVEVLVKMYQHQIQIEKAAPTSGFPRPDVVAADTQLALTDMQANSNILVIPSQNDDEEPQLNPKNGNQDTM